MIEMLLGLGIPWCQLKANVRKIYDFKALISTLEIYGMLDYGKIVLEEFEKKLLLLKVVASRWSQTFTPDDNNKFYKSVKFLT